MIPAERENKKGRAKGGFLIGIRKDWFKSGSKLAIIKKGLIKSEIVSNGKREKLTIWSVYNIELGKEFWKVWENVDRGR